MSTNTKNTKKYDAVRAVCVKELAKKHDVTTQFVRMAINGHASSETAEVIVKEYRELYKKIKDTMTAMSK